MIVRANSVGAKVTRRFQRVPPAAWAVVASVVLVTFVAVAPLAAGSRFEVVVLDGPGVGFNELTAWTPTGGNAATTVGEARRRALDFALSVWAAQLDSPVPVRVGVRFEDLGSGASSAVLGIGGAEEVFRDFAGAPAPATWYAAALADRLAGVDLAPGELDLAVSFNSQVDGPALGERGFSYGLDGTGPEGDPSFVEVALHEVAHGLGFSLFADAVSGEKLLGRDDVYLLHLVRDGTPPQSLAAMSDADRRTALAASGELQWQGPAVAARAGSLTAGATPDGRVRLFAPSPPLGRMTASHFDPLVAPDSFLEPVLVGGAPDFDLARAVLDDLGWGATPGCVERSVP